MPKIAADSVAAHRIEIRQRIYRAFAHLMGEHSFEALTMAQIAAEAGIGRTTIYHHFADREAIVVGFASHETDRYLLELSDKLAERDSATGKLRTYVAHHLVAGADFHMGLGPQLYGLLSDSSRGEIREHVVAVERVLRDIVEAGMASGEFTRADVASTMSLIHACLGPRHLPADEVEHFVLNAVTVPADR